MFTVLSIKLPCMPMLRCSECNSNVKFRMYSLFLCFAKNPILWWHLAANPNGQELCHTATTPTLLPPQVPWKDESTLSKPASLKFLYGTVRLELATKCSRVCSSLTVENAPHPVCYVHICCITNHSLHLDWLILSKNQNHDPVSTHS